MNLNEFESDYTEFCASEKSAETQFLHGKMFPCLNEKGQAGGVSSGHYFHQDLLVAQRIFASRPDRHVDVGSRIDGFVAHVAAFREIEVFDIRPVGSIKNVVFHQVDLMKLPTEFFGYTGSVSCLHALEHFGLGRYGDTIDADGHLKGLKALSNLLVRGGILYLSFPIGPSRIEFNAHRVFSIDYVLSIVARWFHLRRFSFVDDRGDLHEDTALDSVQCFYGCGIFEMERL